MGGSYLVRTRRFGAVAEDQPFSILLTRRLSAADTSVRPARRRVRVLGLCSSRCRRFAFWRTILPVPVRRNRFAAPLWVFALGMGVLRIVEWVELSGLAAGALGLLRRLGASLRAAVRGQHHRHVPAVLFGGGLDVAVLGDIVAQALQQPVPQLGAGLLAATEHDRHLDLRSRFEEPDHVTLLGLVIVRVDLRSQLLFLDDGLLLVLARLARLLGRLVLVLAVVHDLADRRPGVGGDFDKV